MNSMDREREARVFKRCFDLGEGMHVSDRVVVRVLACALLTFKGAVRDELAAAIAARAAGFAKGMGA